MTRYIQLPPIADDMNGFSHIDVNYTSMLDRETKYNISYSAINGEFVINGNPDPNVVYNPKTNALEFTFYTVEEILKAKGKTPISITLKDSMNATQTYHTSFMVVIPDKERMKRPIYEEPNYQTRVKAEIADISDVGIV